MAQYYADIQGTRGAATRMGSKNSGMSGHIRGWSVGAKVFMSWNEQEQRDEVTIKLTGGSRGAIDGKYLGTYYCKGMKIIKASK